MTSAENSVLEPPNLKIFSWRIPSRPRYKARAFGPRDNAPSPPLQKTELRPCDHPLDKTLSWSTRYWVQEIYQLDRNQCIQFRKRSTFWTNGTCCLNPIFFHEDNGTQLEVNQKETAKSAFAVIMEVNGNYEKSRGKRCVLSNVTRGLFILGRE